MRITRAEREQLMQAVSNIILHERLPLDIWFVETGKVLIPANQPITKKLIRRIVTNRHNIELPTSPLKNALRKALKLETPENQIG